MSQSPGLGNKGNEHTIFGKAGSGSGKGKESKYMYEVKKRKRV
jgi:hypothetical protein